LHSLRQLHVPLSDWGHHNGTLLFRGELAMNQPQDDQNVERRDFLSKAAFWTTTSTLAFATIGIARMPKPGVMPGQSSQVKIGTPGEYPVSADPVRVPGQNLYVIHDETGFGVISAVCTHLGCVVAAKAEGFECPCHGSRFATDGKVVRGPAPTALAWYELGLAADGQMVVDIKRMVLPGTKFALS
jgi:Rieske Fe-S protein